MYVSSVGNTLQLTSTHVQHTQGQLWNAIQIGSEQWQSYFIFVEAIVQPCSSLCELLGEFPFSLYYIYYIVSLLQC